MAMAQKRKRADIGHLYFLNQHKYTGITLLSLIVDIVRVNVSIPFYISSLVTLGLLWGLQKLEKQCEDSYRKDRGTMGVAAMEWSLK